MKVAIVEPVGSHGGMHYYDFGLAEGLAAAGVQVFVYTSDITTDSGRFSFFLRPLFKGVWGKANKFIRAKRFIFCLLRSLYDAKRNSISIVHFHFFHYSLIEFFSVFFSRCMRFKVVVTTHDVESFAGFGFSLFSRVVLGCANKIIAHNKVSRMELVKKLHIKQSAIVVIPHGNYLLFCNKSMLSGNSRDVLDIPSDIPVLLFFGQIKEVKGLDILLRALSTVREHIPEIKLLVAGKIWKDNFSKYESLINELGLGENVSLHIRFIPENELPTFYGAADLIVLPYRRIYQSGVLLMAMSMQKPVLASDLDGMTEIIEHDRNGLIFRTGDSQDLAEKIIYALRDRERLERIGREGFETVSKEYSWTAIGQQTAKLYEEIVNR